MASEDTKIDEIIAFFKTEKEREMQEYTLERDHKFPGYASAISIIGNFLTVLIALFTAFFASTGVTVNLVSMAESIVISIVLILILYSLSLRESDKTYVALKKRLKEYDLIITALEARKVLDIEFDASPLKNFVKQRYLRNKQQIAKDDESWLNGAVYCAYFDECQGKNQTK